LSSPTVTTNRGALFIVSAPSGGGKTTLTRAAIGRLATRGIRAEISVSYTTRAPRPGEQDGVHYHFVDEARFVSMIAAGEFLEHAEVFGRRYGTGRQRTQELLERGCDVILDIDWQGARQVRVQAPDAISVFVLPPSLDELERRLRVRAQDDEVTVRKRMAAARDEMVHYVEYDYLIVNEDFERALEELTALFLARRLVRPQQARQYGGLIDSLLR
jgi:guanylate kinase